MTTTNYIPNWDDPRVQARLIAAVKFCERYLRSDRDQWLGTRYIDKSFGSQRNQLSRYLREQLLVVVDNTYNKETGKCKTYRLNSLGLCEIKSLIKNTHNTYSVVDLLNRHQEEIQTGNFDYNDTSSRLYHPIQNISRKNKKQLLAEQGYHWHYDIACAAPTLLLQHSQQMPDPMDLYLFHLEEYIKNRQEIRKTLARDCEVEEQVIKRIINGLFQGAYLSCYRNSLCFKELDGDLARIEFLKENEFLSGLRSDIRVMWQYLKPVMPVRTQQLVDGRTRRVAANGRQKTALYRDLERSVLNSVRDYLDEKSIRYFCEHDGWATDAELDLRELSNWICETTGFRIQIENEYVA